MNSTRPRSASQALKWFSLPWGMSICLAISMFSTRIVACDFCRPLPRNPFGSDHQSAIEVALATQAAAETGQLNLNPSLSTTMGIDRHRTVYLAEISPRQLVRLWIQTRPAKDLRAMRNTVELIFIDVDYTCALDIRFGEILEGNPSDGSADIRVVTTQAGFCQLLETGLESCVNRQLATIECQDEIRCAGFSQLFSKQTKNPASRNSRSSNQN